MKEASESALFVSGTVIQLAKRDDFTIGNVHIYPSLRQVEGPSSLETGEPRVIQVLIALADAQGKVLSREELIRICWEGRIVGVDAVNRAVAEVRRILSATGADFAVETVQRVGYRLIGVDWQQTLSSAPELQGQRISRRQLIAGGVATATLVAGVGAALIGRKKRAEIDALVERGRILQSSGNADAERQAEALFKQAIGMDSERADAWGWLAAVVHDSDKSRKAALHAIELDPREPNARTVLAFQSRDLDAWTLWEDALLEVLDDAPDCALALQHLTFFYQGMGRCKDSWLTNERVIRIEPFNPAHLHRRALKHWIFGRVGAADRVIDQAMRLWPRHAGVWNARMLIYACTNRAPAALALLDDTTSRPESLTLPSIESWRAGLEAIASRTSQAIATALEVCTRTATQAPGLAANAIMLFSYLRKLDAAYEVADGLFEGRGRAIQQRRGVSMKGIYSSSSWGRTQFLFIPATDAFRGDPRFADLCQRLGHVDYWRKRGIWPDSFVRGVIDPAKFT